MIASKCFLFQKVTAHSITEKWRKISLLCANEMAIFAGLRVAQLISYVWHPPAPKQHIAPLAASSSTYIKMQYTACMTQIIVLGRNLQPRELEMTLPPPYRHCAAESYNGAIFLQKLSSAAPVGYTRLQGAQRSRVTQHPPPLMRTTVVVWAKILIRASERERENSARVAFYGPRAKVKSLTRATARVFKRRRRVFCGVAEGGAA